MKARYCFLILLLMLNIICLYFIIDLASYDQMIRYLENGDIKIANLRQISFIFFFTCIINLLFISSTLMESIVFPDKHNTRF